MELTSERNAIFNFVIFACITNPSPHGYYGNWRVSDFVTLTEVAIVKAGITIVDLPGEYRIFYHNVGYFF